jgi:hypothetical protein
MRNTTDEEGGSEAIAWPSTTTPVGNWKEKRLSNHFRQVTPAKTPILRMGENHTRLILASA